MLFAMHNAGSRPSLCLLALTLILYTKVGFGLAYPAGGGLPLASPQELEELAAAAAQKRGWNNFHAGYGKRAWNNNFNSGYGKRTYDYDDESDGDYGLEEVKRAWNSGFNGGVGKRAWNSGFNGGVGKRAWNSGFNGGVGKRAWNNFAGGYGKRAWNNFNGGYGKRSVEEEQEGLPADSSATRST